MRRLIVLLMAAAALSLGGVTVASAQTASEPAVSLSTQTPAPGAPVTVTVTNAMPGNPVVVRLGVIEEPTTVDASGTATVTIAAPTQPGEAVGTVQIGVVDFPITVTVQAAVVPAETTDHDHDHDHHAAADYATAGHRARRHRNACGARHGARDRRPRGHGDRPSTGDRGRPSRTGDLLPNRRGRA